MGYLEEFEDIVEQQRYGYDNPARGVTKGARKSFRRSQRRGAADQRSVEKQQRRSTERREMLVISGNQS